MIENNLLKSLDTAITTKKYEYGIVLKGNVFADVGRAKDMTTPENLNERDMNVTKAILDGYISAWEKASSKNYTEESFKALTDALAAAKAISADSNATQTSIALALQELRIASGGLVWVISDSTDPVNPIDPVDPIEPIDSPRPAIPSYIPAASDSKFPFKDVGRSDAFYDAVKYLYENNIMNGTSRTEFSPNAELTRGYGRYHSLQNGRRTAHRRCKDLLRCQGWSLLQQGCGLGSREKYRKRLQRRHV